jgi:hypothetical protein
MISKRYEILFLVFLFVRNFLSAQTTYAVMDKYSHYEIVRVSTVINGNEKNKQVLDPARNGYVEQSNTAVNHTPTYSSLFFVVNTLKKDSIQLQADGATNYWFDHGLICARVTDVHSWLTLDGKVFLDRADWINFSYDSLIFAPSRPFDNNLGHWAIYNFHGTLLASIAMGTGGPDEDGHQMPYENGKVLVEICFHRTSTKYALLDKTGTWLTEPVFDSIGNFENGKAVAKYRGHEGIVNEKGFFTYTDSVGKINLGGMEKPFPGMGAPYKYMNKQNKIVIPSPTPQVPQLSHNASHPVLSSYLTPGLDQSPKDTTPIFAFHIFPTNSTCKILWRYSDFSDNLPYHHKYTGCDYNKKYKDYFVVDSILKDTICLAHQMDIQNVYFDAPFIFLSYSIHNNYKSKIFTAKGIPVFTDAGQVTCYKSDSIIIDYDSIKGMSIYNWNAQLLYKDTAFDKKRDEIYPAGYHLFFVTKWSDCSTYTGRRFWGLIKSNGFPLTDAVFTGNARFDLNGIAMMRMCNDMEGQLDTLGMFLQNGKQKPFHATIAYLLTDRDYSKIKIVKGEFKDGNGNYRLEINSYCYDKVETKKEFYNVKGKPSSKKYERYYRYYYLNGKLVAKEELDYYKHRQVIMCVNHGRRKRVVNRHYARFTHPC